MADRVGDGRATALELEETGRERMRLWVSGGIEWLLGERLKAIIAATAAPMAFALEYVPLLTAALVYEELAVSVGLVSRRPVRPSLHQHGHRHRQVLQLKKNGG